MISKNDLLKNQNIEQNEPYLAKGDSTELVEFYSERITNYVEYYVGRNRNQ